MATPKSISPYTWEDMTEAARKTLAPSLLASYLPEGSDYTTPSLVANTPTKLLLPTTVKDSRDFELYNPYDTYPTTYPEIQFGVATQADNFGYLDGSFSYCGWISARNASDFGGAFTWDIGDLVAGKNYHITNQSPILIRFTRYNGVSAEYCDFMRADSGQIFPDDAIAHWAFTVDEVTNVVKCYVDGVELNQTANNFTDIRLDPLPVESDSRLNNEDAWIGWARVRVYDGVLSLSEIQTDIQGGYPSSQTLINGWEFDEGVGSSFASTVGVIPMIPAGSVTWKVGVDHGISPDAAYRLNAVGAVDREFSLAFTTSMTSSTNNVVLKLRMYKNGVAEPGASVERKISTGADVGAVPLTDIFKLSHHDKIEVYAEVDLAATLTFIKSSINIIEVN